jgi:hypothetical protein
MSRPGWSRPGSSGSAIRLPANIARTTDGDPMEAE